MNQPSRRHRAASIFLSLALLAGLAACSGRFGSSPQQATANNSKTVAACRQHTDQVFNMQNPAAVYRADASRGGLRDSPYAGAGLPVNPSMGLSAQYDHDNMMNDCLNGLTVNPAEPDLSSSGSVPAAPALPPPARR
jgi:hypothetical protein